LVMKTLWNFLKLLFSVLLTLFLIYNYNGQEELIPVTVINNNVETSPQRLISNRDPINVKEKRILYWNDFYGARNFGFCCGRSPYIKHNCSCRNCYTSKDRDSNISSYDAIVFHGRSLNKHDLPVTRSPHQLYVFLALESAAYPGSVKFKDYNSYFNITMTYRQDSDVFLPYGRVVQAIDPEKPIKKSKKKKKKNHLAAWLVSNCKTSSRREELVRELEKYLPPDSIHIYGECGHRNCPGKSPEERDDCWDMIENKYKFYLSLENSICRDYVTEKLFEALKHDVVPVVLGGADYHNILPKHSFINMLDYKNMSHLAEHLVELDKNEEKYSKYLQWKSRYRVLNSRYDFNQAHCNLCQLVHDYSNSGREKVIEDLNKWFITDSNCRTTSDFQ